MSTISLSHKCSLSAHIFSTDYYQETDFFFMRHTQELLILFLQYMTEILFFCVYICYSVLCVVASATTAAIVTATAYCCHCDRHSLLLLPLCLPLPACRSCSSFVRSFGKLKYIIFPQSKLYYFSFLSVCLYMCVCVDIFFLFLALDKTLIFFSSSSVTVP